MTTIKAKCKIACKSCNLRRVKCDRTEDTPCTFCRLAGQDCQPIVSRRGKYKRNYNNPLGTQSALRRSSRKQQNETIGDTNTTPDTQACGSFIPQPSVPSQRQDCQYSSTRSDSKVVYYGDSFNLDYMLHQMGDPLGTARNGRTWEDTIEHLYFNQLGQSTKAQIEEHSQKERLNLRDIGALKPFEKNVSDDLIRVFFRVWYPQCPIFDRATFQLKYEAGRVSPLVLQAVYFLALSVCNEAIYKRAGFENRYLATFTCYQRAKALYDTNYESDAIGTLQAVYLLSFWWGSPMEQKDMWHWTGVASALAQSLGLHQRKTYVGLSEMNRRLLRRIWWTIYAHDISVALMLGRTPHINDAYCSVEMLGEADFETDDGLINVDLFGKPTRESQLFNIYIAELCSRTSNCWLSISGADVNKSESLNTLDPLTNWKASLPKELQQQEASISEENGFWASLINLTYSTMRILLDRNGFNDPDRLKIGTVVFDAAVQIVRILEDIVTSQLLPFALGRSPPAAFAALSVQIANMRGCPSHVVDVSKHRARLCMFIIKRLQDHSPPLLWYYRLFVRLLHSMDCEIPGEESQETSAQFARHDQRIHSLPLLTDTVLDNNRFEEDFPPGSGANHSANDQLSGDPAFIDFGLPGTAGSFMYSSFLNSDLFDGASTDIGSHI
ncbi:transcription factor domain-containing protein [Aspergillus alliaceus]|uniref:transcription factor domain-containing protein n=1 Tax=Petromyces alliaceus TaxID=209559 RepID=UPI0012A44320|nr:fungal-specific transcription factor domain-containing protein [Aspergillus alliaceus]KAB8232854.1 fungal-specific transcription factor domain-containing protein [Aspergillus alliaceus]